MNIWGRRLADVGKNGRVDDGCLSCELLAGVRALPGGIVAETGRWVQGYNGVGQRPSAAIDDKANV
jgi:hypothetical protein